MLKWRMCVYMGIGEDSHATIVYSPSPWTIFDDAKKINNKR